MSPHPNRSKHGPRRNPRPEELVALRESANLTPEGAAALIDVDGRTIRKWEAGDRQMHPAFWRLLRLEIAALRDAELAARMRRAVDVAAK